jgi:Kazal-type serine protease inhibitor-like protein
MIDRLIHRIAGAAILALALVLLAPAGASAAGVGQACGGILPLQCDDGLFCQNPVGRCGPAVTGKCAKVPQACPQQIVRPVCGCDDKTYSNDCMRQMAKVSKKHNGRCKPAKG